MKLALNGLGRHPDFTGGYDLYTRRSRAERGVSYAVYKRIVRMYCRLLAERLSERGMVDLPKGLGSIAAAVITRKPQYRGRRFIGYGGMDWKTGHLDGRLKTFGIVYLPRRGKNANLRCLGFVANRRLFRKMKQMFSGDSCLWTPIDFNDDMI